MGWNRGESEGCVYCILVWSLRVVCAGRGVEAETAMSSYSGVPAFLHNHTLSAPKSVNHNHQHRIILTVNVSMIPYS